MNKYAYNVTEASEATGIAVTKIKELVRRGEIAAKYAGKDILILPAELERWVNSLPDQRP